MKTMRAAWRDRYCAPEELKARSIPIPSNIRRSLEFVAGLAAKGGFKPLIDKHYPLKKAGEAYAYAASGQKIGNIILDLK